MVIIFPVESADIERNKINSDDTSDDILKRTATEYLTDKLGFKLAQINDMNIKGVTKTKKVEGKTLYITFEHQSSVSQIFKRAAIIQNKKLKISNFVPPHFFNRYHTLQTYYKEAREKK